jgi:hypothetical protein
MGVFLRTVDQQILNDDVAWLAGEWVRELEDRCCEDDQTDFENGIILDDRIFPERSRPHEVELAEQAAKNAATDPKEDEHRVVIR